MLAHIWVFFFCLNSAFLVNFDDILHVISGHFYPDSTGHDNELSKVKCYFLILKFWAREGGKLDVAATRAPKGLSLKIQQNSWHTG